MTRDDLASFRASLVSCEVILLADVSARTVLICDSAVKLAQERLDELCALASRIFADRDALAASTAIIAGPTGSRVFLPLPADPAEVLCCLFPPGADLSGLEAMAATLFAAEV